MAEALDRFLEATGGGALFLPFQQESVAIENDAAVAERVRAKMRRAAATEILPGGNSPRRLAAAIGDCDLVLAMRMHSGLFAALAGIPVVALDYDPKVSRFMRQIGQPDYAVSLESVRGEGLAGSLAQAFEERGRYSRHLADRTKGLAALARRNAEVAIERLDAASTPPAATEGLVDLLRRTARSQFRTERTLTVNLEERNRSLSILADRHAKSISSLTGSLAEKEREAAALSQALRASEIARRGGDPARPARGSVSSKADFRDPQRDPVDPYVPLLEDRVDLLGRPAAPAPALRVGRRAAAGGHRAAPPAIPAPSRSRALPRAPSPAPLAAENLYDVVCLPIIDWDFRFQRPQQLMSRFAAAGHRVFYVAQTFRPSGPPYEIREKRDNVFEVSLRGPARNVYKESLDDAARDALFAVARSPCGGTSRSAPRPSSSSSPSGGRSPERRARSSAGRSSTTAWTTTPASRRTAPRWWTRRRTSRRRRPRRGLVQAARALRARLERQRPAAAQCVRRRSTSRKVGSGRARAARRRLLRRHRRLVRLRPRRRPGAERARLGLRARRLDRTRRDTSRLSKLPNVSFPARSRTPRSRRGSRRWTSPSIPFKRLPLTEATSPVKAYEILAAGKPLVAVPIPEVVPMAPLVRLASTAEEFERGDRRGARGRRSRSAGAAAGLRPREHLAETLRDARARGPRPVPEGVDRRRHVQQPRR